MMTRILLSILLILCLGCGRNHNNTHADPAALDNWDELLSKAEGAEVTMMMWQGDPFINAYMKDHIIPWVKDSFDIKLQMVNGQGNVIVQTLGSELQTGRKTGEIDIVWINGETFYQLREINALFGPWVEYLPNAEFINLDNTFIAQDFQQPTEGYECPWGNVQMCFIYDSAKVSQPPLDAQSLYEWCKANPGKFTWDNHFTGLTFLKALLTDFAGGNNALNGPFDEEKYRRASEKLWDYLRMLKPYLWNKGQSFPPSVAQMHQLFANGEIYFTMSNNDSEVDNKIIQKVFPLTARAYVPSFGSIQNSHYLGIPRLAPNKEAALVVVNTLVSPKAQYLKSDPSIWGDGTVLNMDKLPDSWRSRFQNIPNRMYAPKRENIARLAIQEPDPEYMIRLDRDFRKEIMQK